MDQFRIIRMYSNDPVLLEEDKQLDNPALVTPYIRHVDYCKHVFPILLQLRPLIPVNNILDGLVVYVKSALQISKFFSCWTFSVYAKHFPFLNLIRKDAHILCSCTVAGRFEKLD